MKRLLVLFMALGVASISAQTTNAAGGPSKPKIPPVPIVSTNSTALHVTTNALSQATSPAAQTQAPSISAENAFTFHLPKANEIVSGKISYDGSAVEAFKTGKPWQLLNPLAPPRYGSPEDNVARDPINGRVIGLKVFAIRF